jgi:large subunit ribosomal protein L16
MNINQMDTILLFLKKNLNKTNKIWINIFPHLPYNCKPVEVRMGKGKGVFNQWICNIQPGMVLFSLSLNITDKNAFNLLNKISKKLPFQTKCVLL